MITSGRGGCAIRFPFTPSQRQELEQQALIFKYMLYGVPIPPHLLLFTLTTRSSTSSLLHLTLPQSSSSSSVGWRCFEKGRKIDPEPWRCRRTDGKKWRCSKEAFQDSKYCERHMHRGKNRSRKHVEQQQHTPSLTKKTSHHPYLDTSSRCLKLGLGQLNDIVYDVNETTRRDGHPTVYGFLEEGPPEKKNYSTSSWLNLDDKSSTTTTQLSISIPTDT